MKKNEFQVTKGKRYKQLGWGRNITYQPTFVTKNNIYIGIYVNKEMSERHIAQQGNC